MKNHSADVAIVGAGILGLAHAYAAARAGKRVVVFDRSPQAAGASVRNFGMVWPIGQPSGELLQLALRSRAIWLELLDATQLPYRDTGSLHLTYRNDEAAVAQEFAAIAPGLGYNCCWHSPAQVFEKSEAVQPRGLLGALWSDTELTVDPRQILAALPAFLAERYGVQFHFSTAVRAINAPYLETAACRWHAGHFIVCSGEDFETLYPTHFAQSGLTRCKLQMLRTAPQPAGWQLGPSLAANCKCFAPLRSLQAGNSAHPSLLASPCAFTQPSTYAPPCLRSGRALPKRLRNSTAGPSTRSSPRLPMELSPSATPTSTASPSTSSTSLKSTT